MAKPTFAFKFLGVIGICLLLGTQAWGQNAGNTSTAAYSLSSGPVLPLGGPPVVVAQVQAGTVAPTQSTGAGGGFLRSYLASWRNFFGFLKPSNSEGDAQSNGNLNQAESQLVANCKDGGASLESLRTAEGALNAAKEAKVRAEAAKAAALASTTLAQSSGETNLKAGEQKEQSASAKKDLATAERELGVAIEQLKSARGDVQRAATAVSKLEPRDENSKALCYQAKANILNGVLIPSIEEMNQAQVSLEGEKSSIWSTIGNVAMWGAGAAALVGTGYLVGRNNPSSKFKNDGGGGSSEKKNDKDGGGGNSGSQNDEQQCPDGLIKTPSGTCALPPPTNNPGAGDTTEASSGTTGGTVTTNLGTNLGSGPASGSGALTSGAADNRGAQGRGLAGSGAFGAASAGGASSGGGLGAGEPSVGRGLGSASGSSSGGGGSRLAMGSGYNFGASDFGGMGGGRNGTGEDTSAGGPVVDQNYIDGAAGNSTRRIKFRGKLLTAKECRAIAQCRARNAKILELRTRDPRLQ